MSRQDVLALVRNYVLNLNHSGIPVEKVFLFGSYARNEAKPDSDIDVLLVSDVFENADEKILAKAWSLDLRVDYRIEPVMMSNMEYNTDDLSPIIDETKRTGIEVKI